MDDRSNLRARIEISWSLALGLRSAAASVAAAVPILALGAGCQDGDGDDVFRITAVAFDNDSTITLSFSEPVANAGEIDPSAFRLSWATTFSMTYSYEGVPPYVYSYTIYRDLSSILDDYDYNYDGELFSFMSVSPGATADQLVLTTSVPLGPKACEELEEMAADVAMYVADDPTAQFNFGIFLHHAGGDVPIESEKGSVLGDIGADWALSDDWYTGHEGYGFVNLAPQLRIPCS